jgi:hypothetical protein
LAGGQVVEDIDNFNRLSCMLTSLTSESEQLSIASEGFGSFDDKYGAGVPDLRKSFIVEDHDTAGVIRESRRVLFKPMVGIFNQDKLLPIRYMPLQIELELVSTSTDAVFISTETGADWSISDAQVKCDLLTLDNALDNEYAALLLSGKSLPINFSSWNHTVQQTGGDKDFSVNISRALTRLKSVFVTLYNPSTHAKLGEANFFYHPMSTQALEGSFLSEEHQMWIQIGSQKFPEYPINSCSEAFYHLKKTVGSHMFIYNRWFRTSKYIIGIDTEKIAGAGFTGLNTKAGDLLTINFRDCNYNNVATTVPQKIFCALHYDAILNIRDNGVEVME